MFRKISIALIVIAVALMPLTAMAKAKLDPSMYGNWWTVDANGKAKDPMFTIFADHAGPVFLSFYGTSEFGQPMRINALSASDFVVSSVAFDGKENSYRHAFSQKGNAVTLTVDDGEGHTWTFTVKNFGW